jgi:hypothetical protein
MLITYVALSVPGRRQETPQKHFRRFKRKLARAGLPAAATEGPRDLALRAAAAFPEHTGEILAIGAEYAALVYAPAGRAELKSLRRRVHRLSLARADTGTTQR